MSPIGKLILSARAEESTSKVQAMCDLAVVSKDNALAVLSHLMAWGFVMIETSVVNEEGYDPHLWIDAYRDREKEFKVVDKAFDAMDVEPLRALTGPLPAKYQRAYLAGKAKVEAETQKKMRALGSLEGGILGSLKELGIDLPNEGEHDCAKCFLADRCPLPQAVEWRASQKKG